jgi:ankyrin repeat protein
VSFCFICLFICACGSISTSNRERRVAPPLYNAINQGNLDDVILLVQSGVEINNNAGWSSYLPLEAAARQGHTEIALYLISQGAENINVAFQQAIEQRHYNTAKAIYQTGQIHYFILEELFGFRRINTEEKIEIFKMITDNQLSNNYFLLDAEPDEIVGIITKYNININSVITDNGETLLHVAARRNNIGLINYLINNNFDLNTPDKHGNTALFYAISAAGPNINWFDPFYEDQYSIHKNTLSVPRRGSPPFPNFQAQMERSERLINIIKLLCENGININAQNNFGWTALHLSYIGYSEDLQELLINYGTNTDIKTLYNRLPEDFKVE